MFTAILLYHILCKMAYILVIFPILGFFFELSYAYYNSKCNSRVEFCWFLALSNLAPKLATFPYYSLCKMAIFTTFQNLMLSQT